MKGVPLRSKFLKGHFKLFPTLAWYVWCESGDFLLVPTEWPKWGPVALRGQLTSVDTLIFSHQKLYFPHSIFLTFLLVFCLENILKVRTKYKILHPVGLPKHTDL